METKARGGRAGGAGSRRGDCTLSISRTWQARRGPASARSARHWAFTPVAWRSGPWTRWRWPRALTLLNAALGWPHARYRVRSGPDGADLALLDVLRHENVAQRFTHVAIGSGDHLFAEEAAHLAAHGVWVTVVGQGRAACHRGLPWPPAR